MKLVLLFIVVLVCVICFTADGGKIRKKPKARKPTQPNPFKRPKNTRKPIKVNNVFDRPGFTGPTKKWTLKISEDLNRPVTIKGGYHRAHVISFHSIRMLITDTFKKSGDPQTWKRLAKELNEDLHTFDTDWFLYDDMEKTNSWPEYIKINNKSKRKIDEKIKAIVDNKRLDNNSSLAELIKLMNSAPANLRPGYGSENSGIGEYMDPLKGDKIKNAYLREKDLTQRSRDLKVKYSLEWKTINGQFIRSSDVPKV